MRGAENEPSEHLQEKARVIGTVLWLLEDHHRMIAIGRTTPRAQWISAGAPAPYRAPDDVPEDPCDPAYPDEAFMIRQREVSAAYRLWPISLALQKLWREEPRQAAAVEALYVDIPPAAWFYPAEAANLAWAGLLFMARCVPGKVPEYQPAPPPRTKTSSRDAEIVRLKGAGWTYKQIEKKLRCAPVTISAALSGTKVRSGRKLDADGA